MPQPNLGFIPLAKHTSAVKSFPSYICKSIQLSLWQVIADTVGSTEPSCLLQPARSIPAPPQDFKGNVQISSFSHPFWNSYAAIPLYLYNLHALAVSASSHLVKELSFISFKLVSYQLHWVPHSSNILKFGKQQLLISFIKSWRQWINLYHVLELSWSGSGQLSCPTGFKLWASSLSGPSIQASCFLP